MRWTSNNINVVDEIFKEIGTTMVGDIRDIKEVTNGVL